MNPKRKRTQRRHPPKPKDNFLSEFLAANEKYEAELQAICDEQNKLIEAAQEHKPGSAEHNRLTEKFLSLATKGFFIKSPLVSVLKKRRLEE